MTLSPKPKRRIATESFLPGQGQTRENQIVSPRSMHHIKRRILRKLALRMEKEGWSYN